MKSGSQLSPDTSKSESLSMCTTSCRKIRVSGRVYEERSQSTSRQASVRRAVAKSESLGVCTRSCLKVCVAK